MLPAEDDRRASLARDPWRVLEAEQQQLGTGGGSGGDAAGEAGGGNDAERQGGGGLHANLQTRLYPEAELVVEPEQEGSDDDGAGRDEHVRQLVQAYRQQGEQVGGPPPPLRRHVDAVPRCSPHLAVLHVSGVLACWSRRQRRSSHSAGCLTSSTSRCSWP